MNWMHITSSKTKTKRIIQNWKFAIYNLELVNNDNDKGNNNKHNTYNNMITIIIMLITKIIKLIKLIKLIKIICVDREGLWFEHSVS